MKDPMYEEWTKPRIKKIENIFGKNWFINRNIFDVGCSYGEIGEHFIKLGANVTFTDLQDKCLQAIKDRFADKYGIEADTIKLDQNEPYQLDRHYDLAIHCGVLYCLSNWKKNLETVMRHADHMILETAIDPLGVRDIPNSFTECELERHLKDLGCKFLKICDPDLNAYGKYFWEGGYAFQKYDWLQSDFAGNPSCQVNERGYSVIPRRMWLVIK